MAKSQTQEVPRLSSPPVLTSSDSEASLALPASRTAKARSTRVSTSALSHREKLLAAFYTIRERNQAARKFDSGLSCSAANRMGQSVRARHPELPATPIGDEALKSVKLALVSDGAITPGKGQYHKLSQQALDSLRRHKELEFSDVADDEQAAARYLEEKFASATKRQSARASTSGASTAEPRHDSATRTKGTRQTDDANDEHRRENEEPRVAWADKSRKRRTSLDIDASRKKRKFATEARDEGFEVKRKRFESVGVWLTPDEDRMEVDLDAKEDESLKLGAGEDGEAKEFGDCRSTSPGGELPGYRVEYETAELEERDEEETTRSTTSPVKAQATLRSQQFSTSPSTSATIPPTNIGNRQRLNATPSQPSNRARQIPFHAQHTPHASELETSRLQAELEVARRGGLAQTALGFAIATILFLLFDRFSPPSPLS